MMNHAAIVNHESERVTRQRSFILAYLDEQHFEALNPDDHVLDLNGYCLDALEYLPAGGMESDLPRGWKGATRIVAGRQLEVCRGYSMEDLRERNALAERLIAEILAEEAAP